MKTVWLIFLLVFIVPLSVHAQNNFRAGFEKAHVLTVYSNLPLDIKLKTHITFLDSAKKVKNLLYELYGNLFIYYDYLKEQDYVSATNYLLIAEKIAEESGKPGWQGWVAGRKGQLSMFLDEENKSLDAYHKAAKLCGQAGDSLCLAESLEQISAISSQVGKDVEAEEYFHLALPLLEKYGSTKQLSVTYNNRGNFLIHQNKPTEAIPFIKKARDYFHEKKLYPEEGKTMNNLAEALRLSGKVDSAIALFNYCLQFNESHQLQESKINNYHGLHQCYIDKGNFKLALENYVKHIELRDSLVGAEVKEKIARLETSFNVKEKELSLEKTRVKMITNRRQLERLIYGILILLFISVAVIIRKRKQHEKAKTELEKNMSDLKNVTQLLIAKNTKITELEDLLSNVSQPLPQQEKNEDEFAETLYSQRILTNEDWASFKIYFDKTYPGYIQKLRTAHPDISEAEERLFLFIKLKLTNKEAAAILGISADSIKKTRNRLRKRLALDQTVSLDDFVNNF